jgi:hypothetical protein
MELRANLCLQTNDYIRDGIQAENGGYDQALDSHVTITLGASPDTAPA